ncbi:unnamed protein product [Caenorhabditis nigoni]
MDTRNRNETGHSSPNDIISTFNHFFKNVPSNKSFDMSYKVYIRDLADTEDRSTLSARSSLINVQGVVPTTIASFGNVPIVSASSTSVDQSSYLSASSATSSSTNLSMKSPVTMTHIDRLCEDNMARKERSMLNLNELSQQLGDGNHHQKPITPVKTPSTVYENLNILKPTVSSTPNPSNVYTEVHRDFDKVADSEEKGDDGKFTLYIKVTDCFD